MIDPAVQIRGARPGEIDAVHRMLERAFSGVPRSFFDRRVKSAPRFRPGHTRVALVGGRIAACARVYFRDVLIAGQTVPCGGLGDVASDPDFHGLGLASQCVTDALAFMKRRGVPLSMLFTHIQPFYARLGYFSISTLDLTFGPPETDSPTRCRRIRSKDLGRLAVLHRRYAESRSGLLHRNASYWRLQARFPSVNPSFFWAGTSRGALTCYARGFPGKDGLIVQEFGFDSGAESSLASLLGRMAGLTGRARLVLPFASEPELELFRPWLLSVNENTRWMVRLVDLERRDLLKALLKKGKCLFWDSDRF